TTIFIGISAAAVATPDAAAVATPDYDGQVFQSDSTGADTGPGPVIEGWVRDTIRSARREADEIAATVRENGISIAPVRHEIEHRVHFRSPEIVSVLREDRAYGDGAHESGANGSLWLIPVNWDARTGALIPIQSVLGDPADSQAAYDRVAAMLREATVEQVWDGAPRAWGEAIEAAIRPDPMYLSTFTFVPSTVPDRIGGIAWHFEPGMVAPGPEGAVGVVIPQEDLREIVAPEWRELFAGEPAEIPDARYVSPGNELWDVLARY
ncbi:MAG TPA: hypothetical protein VFJ13_07590, partial [Paracoccaceae bacterium]|nr:hypothetical protein [Paracoccaceae bacterium]